MAIESINNQSKFIEVQKTNLKAVESSTIANTEKPIIMPAQGSKTVSSDSANTEDGQNQASPESRIKSAVNLANKQMKQAKTRCEFSYHEQTNRVSIKVIDAETKEVIREIPPDETLEMVEKMWELAGILIDEKR